MKLLKYILIAIVFAATTGEAFGQAKVLSGKVTEMFGTTAEPMIGVNVNILNSQNRSLGGTVTNLDGIYNLPIPSFFLILEKRVKESNTTVRHG